MTDPTADPMVDVTLHVSSYHEAVIRLDERRKVSRLAKAHTSNEGGDLIALQRALTDPKARRSVALFVGFLVGIFDADVQADIEPFISLEDRWVGRTA